MQLPVEEILYIKHYHAGSAFLKSSSSEKFSQ